MSYHVYTTKAITLSYRPRREADRIYAILTRDLGLIRATALGVRKEHSKLRGLLEPITLGNVSLVRGKEFWRVTSVEFLKKIESTAETLKPLALLERLVQGEAHHELLYDTVEEFLLNEPRDEQFESRFVAHLLYQLGYLKKEDLTLPKQKLIEAINAGLYATELQD